MPKRPPHTPESGLVPDEIEPELDPVNSDEAIVEEDRQAKVERSLRAIYGHESQADFGRLERRRPRRWIWALFILLIVAGFFGAAAWTGFRLFQPFRGFSQPLLKLSIAGPTTIDLGELETYQINWSNEDAQPLTQASLRLTLPPDFVATSLQPSFTDKTMSRWDFVSIPAHASGTIQISGVFVGALGSQGALQVIGSYRPATYDRDFETLAVQPVTYAGTVLDATVNVPAKVMAGDAVAIRYHIANHGTQPMKGLLARFHLPDKFVPTNKQAAMENNGQDALLPISDLPAHASTTVVLDGAFLSDAAGDLTFSVEAGHHALGGEFFPAQHTDGRISVVTGDFSLRFVINGSNTDRSIQPGDPLRLAVAYQNTSVETLKDVQIRVGFESFVNGRSATGTSLLDWNRIETSVAAASSTRSRVQTLTYDKKNVPAFEAFMPQDSGTIEITIPALAMPKDGKDATIRVSVDGFVAMVGSAKVQRAVHVQPVVLRYRSDADVAVQARYFTEEGAPLGFGPLPPVANKTTAYRVEWHLTKSLHPLQGVVITAKLPPIAAWSARALSDGGVVSYDPDTHEVRWTIDQMTDATAEATADFEVQLTPDANDIGRFADLLGETSFQAEDSLLNELISRNKPALTTDLQEDEGARGKGVVRKE